MKKRVDLIGYLFAGILFLYSGVLIFMKDKELVYPILTVLCAAVMFSSAFQTTNGENNYIKNENYEN